MANTNNFFSQKKEWSKFKDTLLGNYLKPYFAKILHNRHSTYYIEGFSGKGKFDDGNNGSPLMVLDLIDEVMASSAKPNSRVIPYFVEYKYYTELSTNIGMRGTVCGGDYKAEVPKLLKKLNTDSNVFLYVDPFGIKHLHFSVFEGLKCFKSYEMLMNFNSYGFLREGCRLLGKAIAEADDEFSDDDDTAVNSIANMNAVASGSYWQDIINDYYNGNLTFEEAESRFITEYETKLRTVFKSVFSIPIKTTLKGQPKYRMLYATNYWQGVFLMTDEMIKCNNEMRTLAQKSQTSIFDYDYTKMDCDADILSLLDAVRFVDVRRLCYNLYDRYGRKYLTKDIKASLKKLEADGKISIERDPMLTPTGKPSKSFDFTGEIILKVIRL